MHQTVVEVGHVTFNPAVGQSAPRQFPVVLLLRPMVLKIVEGRRGGGRGAKMASGNSKRIWRMFRN